jgi:hypothetical protein
MEIRQNPEQPTFHKRPVSPWKTCWKRAIGEVMGVARSITIRRRGGTMQARNLVCFADRARKQPALRR